MNKLALDNVTIEITNQCQLRCRHCGIWNERSRHEMTASFVTRMIANLLAQYRVRFISVTGGEPFLNRNCGRILRAVCKLRAMGLINGAGVYTNAVCYDPISRFLSAYARDLDGLEMGISLDGGEGTHDLLRGQGSYRKTLKTIQFIFTRFSKTIALDFKFTVNTLNFQEVWDVYCLSKRYKARFYPKIMETDVTGYYHRCASPQSPKLADLTPSMVETVRGQIDRIIADGYSGIDPDLLGGMLTLLTKGRNAIRTCATPQKALFINSRRDVYPCLYLSPAGRVDEKGNLPLSLKKVREEHALAAARGDCPGCFAYHGVLKKFNLENLRP